MIERDAIASSWLGSRQKTENINQTQAKKRKSIGNKCSIRYRLFTGAILDDSPPSYKISVNIISEDIVSRRRLLNSNHFIVSIVSYFQSNTNAVSSEFVAFFGDDGDDKNIAHILTQSEINDEM